MRITVHAKPAAKVAAITELGPNELQVAVKEPPVQGKANQAIIEALAQHFEVSKHAVRLISGFTSRVKIFEITIE